MTPKTPAGEEQPTPRNPSWGKRTRKTQTALQRFEAWQDRWSKWSRDITAGIVAVIWVALSVAVGVYVVWLCGMFIREMGAGFFTVSLPASVMSSNSLPMASILLAWSGLTVAIHRALTPRPASGGGRVPRSRHRTVDDSTKVVPKPYAKLRKAVDVHIKELNRDGFEVTLKDMKRPNNVYRLVVYRDIGRTPIFIVEFHAAGNLPPDPHPGRPHLAVVKVGDKHLRGEERQY